MLTKPDSTLTPTEVQALLSSLTGEDRLKIYEIPGRIVMKGHEEALTRSLNGECYFRQLKTPEGWTCGCGVENCEHVQSLEKCLQKDQSARHLIAKATSQGQPLGGLVHKEDSRALSLQVKTELKALGFDVRSVRASTRAGHRGLEVKIPRGERDYPTWLDEVREPVVRYLDGVIGDEMPVAVSCK